VQTPFLGELPEGFRPCRAQPLRLRALRPRRTRSSPATSVACEACPDHPDASARKRAARRTCFLPPFGTVWMTGRGLTARVAQATSRPLASRRQVLRDRPSRCRWSQRARLRSRCWERNGAGFVADRPSGRSISGGTRVQVGETGAWKDLGGERSPWKDRARHHRQRRCRRYGLDDGARPRGRRPGRTASGGRLWQRRRPRFAGAIGGNGEGATAAVTRCGCRREEFFEGCETRREEASARPRGRSGSPGMRRGGVDWPETRRTPGSAAGCNKPATSERRKPSRWCETTRTERDFEDGSSEPMRMATCAGVDARQARRWRGGCSVPGSWPGVARRPVYTGPVARDESQERRPSPARAAGR
jgi:hypothetical protein